MVSHLTDIKEKIVLYNTYLFLGCFGVHAVMSTADCYTHAFYGKLGFVENTHEAVKGRIVMGRTF